MYGFPKEIQRFSKNAKALPGGVLGAFFAKFRSPGRAPGPPGGFLMFSVGVPGPLLGSVPKSRGGPGKPREPLFGSRGAVSSFCGYLEMLKTTVGFYNTIEKRRSPANCVEGRKGHRGTHGKLRRTEGAWGAMGLEIGGVWGGPNLLLPIMWEMRGGAGGGCRGSRTPQHSRKFVTVCVDVCGVFHCFSRCRTMSRRSRK